MRGLFQLLNIRCIWILQRCNMGTKGGTTVYYQLMLFINLHFSAGELRTLNEAENNSFTCLHLTFCLVCVLF